MADPDLGSPLASPTRLPTQLATWLPERSGYDTVSADGPSEGEWLYGLKDTRPGDRQIVWSGLHGKGIVGVVDFGADVREREPEDGTRTKGRYEGWGVYTPFVSRYRYGPCRHILICGGDSRVADSRRCWVRSRSVERKLLR